MGSLCSKRGTHSEDGFPLRPRAAKDSKGQTLGSGVLSGATAASNGGGGGGAAHTDPRAAAAEAAEQRMKAAQQRGVVSSNPKGGQLAAQLEANKAAPRVPEPRQEERLVWD